MERVSIVHKTKVRNRNIFGNDKCYKHSLCGGGSCNDCYSLDTSKGGGVGKPVIRRARSGQSTSEKLCIIVSIKRL